MFILRLRRQDSFDLTRILIYTDNCGLRLALARLVLWQACADSTVIVVLPIGECYDVTYLF